MLQRSKLIFKLQNFSSTKLSSRQWRDVPRHFANEKKDGGEGKQKQQNPKQPNPQQTKPQEKQQSAPKQTQKQQKPSTKQPTPTKSQEKQQHQVNRSNCDFCKAVQPSSSSS